MYSANIALQAASEAAWTSWASTRAAPPDSRRAGGRVEQGDIAVSGMQADDAHGFSNGFDRFAFSPGNGARDGPPHPFRASPLQSV
jgi:hypothetical protein